VRILGIDPGISGACALIDKGLSVAEQGPTPDVSDMTVRWLPDIFRDVIDIPTLGNGAQREIDDLQLIRWLREVKPTHAFIEWVTAMPSIPDAAGKRRGMGAASAFKFGFAVGQIRTAVRGCQIPITLVTAAKWKKLYALKGGDKEPSRQAAIRLFPSASHLLARKLDHQRAEAILIAAYGGKML
jgi:hypothetical protein